MRALRSFAVAVVAFVVLATPVVVLADGRVALVVGNSTYAHIRRLPNADNDAADMSAALRRLGFDVTTELDEAEVHRPPAALENRLEDAVVTALVCAVDPLAVQAADARAEPHAE